MTYYLLFILLTITPYFLMYRHQKNNALYAKYKWDHWNEFGFYLALIFFIFIALAPILAQNFFLEFNDINFNKGKRQRIPYEFVFSGLWFIGLSMVSFPHVYKKASMPILPTGLQLASEYKTSAQTTLGIIMLALCIFLTIIEC